MKCLEDLSGVGIQKVKNPTEFILYILCFQLSWGEGGLHPGKVTSSSQGHHSHTTPKDNEELPIILVWLVGLW